jgi:hypothetical protein
MVLGRAAVTAVGLSRLGAGERPLLDVPAAPCSAAELGVPWLASNSHVYQR